MTVPGLQQPVLPLDVSVLQQPMQPLDVSVLQQPMQPLDVSVLQQPMQPLDVSVLQQSMQTLNVSVLQQPTAYALYAALDVSVLQQPMQPLDMSVLQDSLCTECSPGTYIFYSIRAVPLLSLSVFLFYRSLYCPRRCLACSSLYFTRTYICSTAAFAVPQGLRPTLQQLLLHWTVCLQEPVLHLDVSATRAFDFLLHQGCLSS
jgi:hypothetical protein